MLLTEAQGKTLLAAVRIPVPAGRLVGTASEAAAVNLPYPVAVKAQVAVSGRGLQGGVVRCDTPDEVRHAFDAVTAIAFDGVAAKEVLVEEWLYVAREIYLSVTVDATTGGMVVLYSPAGGIGVESTPPTRYDVGLPHDFRAHKLRDVLAPVESDRVVREKVVALCRRLVGAAEAHSCMTIEINPLVMQRDGTLVAADAKVVLDDAAAFRSARIAELLHAAMADEVDDVRHCLELGLSVVWLNGDVGLVSSGAGMTMAAMDALAAVGAAPACFLDVSGNPTPAGFAAAIGLLDRHPDVTSILISIFGGGMHVDRVARTLLSIAAGRTSTKPLSLRLGGSGTELASKILADAGYTNHRSLESAVAAAAADATVRSLT